tara:strand:+ start:312 stop:1232 length:921 start_codon:yes stop_codon:yes gene_type:complete
MEKIKAKHFEIFNPLSIFFKQKLKEFSLSFKKPTNKERDIIINELVEFLNNEKTIVSGKHRKDQWENGWNENLLEFKKTKKLDALIPKYFDKFKVQRLNGDFIFPVENNFEIKFVSLFQYALFNKYFKNEKVIYEFGAGTGHNLLRLREINKNAKLYSFEWTNSGVKLINLVADFLNDNYLRGIKFDNFNPDFSIKLEKNSSIYTFAALEQLGNNFTKLLDYILLNKPKFIVNVEPLAETLNTQDLLQNLSIKYFKKRNYLNDYVIYLKFLEKQKKVKIIDSFRTGFGSKYIEGYSIVIWKPIIKN